MVPSPVSAHVPLEHSEGEEQASPRARPEGVVVVPASLVRSFLTGGGCGVVHEGSGYDVQSFEAVLATLSTKSRWASKRV